MRSLGLRYTVAALTFAISLGVNINNDPADQANSGTWLGSALTVSGAQADHLYRNHGHGGIYHDHGRGGIYHGRGGDRHFSNHGHGGIYHDHGHGGIYHGRDGGHDDGGYGDGGHGDGGHNGHGHDHDDHHHHNGGAGRPALGPDSFLTALPADCPLVGLYYYCGGVYYRSTLQHGSTLYHVVTP